MANFEDFLAIATVLTNYCVGAREWFRVRVHRNNTREMDDATRTREGVVPIAPDNAPNRHESLIRWDQGRSPGGEGERPGKKDKKKREDKAAIGGHNTLKHHSPSMAPFSCEPITSSASGNGIPVATNASTSRLPTVRDLYGAPTPSKKPGPTAEPSPKCVTNGKASAKKPKNNLFLSFHLWGRQVEFRWKKPWKLHAEIYDVTSETCQQNDGGVASMSDKKDDSDKGEVNASKVKRFFSKKKDQTNAAKKDEKTMHAENTIIGTAEKSVEDKKGKKKNYNKSVEREDSMAMKEELHSKGTNTVKNKTKNKKDKTKNNKDKTKENKDKTKENKDKTKNNKDKTKENKDKTNENKDKTKENKDKTKENKNKTKENKDKTKENKDKTKENKDMTKENKDTEGETVNNKDKKAITRPLPPLPSNAISRPLPPLPTDALTRPLPPLPTDALTKPLPPLPSKFCTRPLAPLPSRTVNRPLPPLPSHTVNRPLPSLPFKTANRPLTPLPATTANRLLPPETSNDGNFDTLHEEHFEKEVVRKRWKVKRRNPMSVMPLPLTASGPGKAWE